MTETALPLPEAATAAHEPAGRAPHGFGAIAILATLVVFAGVVVVPILATAINGFKELGDVQANPFGLPRVWVWKNYLDILTGYRYWQVLGNSLLIALLTVALTLAFSSMAAFTFAHLRFFGDRFLLNYLCSGFYFLSRRRFCRCSSRSAISAFSIPIWAWSCLRSLSPLR